MSWLRDNDRWLIEAVLPSAGRYRALAARLLGPADADDLVQEAYAKLLTVTGWRSIANPVAFTLQMVRNLALDRLRRADIVRIEQFAAADLAEIRDDAPDPYVVVAGQRELDRMFDLIATLPPRCRTVVQMRKLEGKAPREIADSLGLSVSTVEKHLAKGLALLTRAAAADLAEAAVEDSPVRWTLRNNRT